MLIFIFIEKSKIITGKENFPFRGPRRIVASIGDCGSPDRGSIPLGGLHFCV